MTMTLDEPPVGEADGPRPTARRSARGRRFAAWVTLMFARPMRAVGHIVFSSLSRRIISINLIALGALLFGILLVNQYRAGLIEERIDRLKELGQVVAAAIAVSAGDDSPDLTDPDAILRLQTEANPTTDEFAPFGFTISPDRVAPFLRNYISPTRTRARIYDRDGFLIVDSRMLHSRGDLLRPDSSPRPPAVLNERPIWERLGDLVGTAWRVVNGTSRLEVYEELGPANGKGYTEVGQALGGGISSIVRQTEKAELIVSIAFPIQRNRTVLGVLLLSTQAGDIDAIVRAEQLLILRVFLVALTIMVVLSLYLASTIALPMRKLAAAADQVRRSVKARGTIPEFPDREDEIGHLSRALREMTSALYDRMEAIESFAADVSHELKNPLTSLRSAVETLPLAKTAASRERLLAVIQHDVRRLDRLITDISDASRLDAEMAREDLKPMDLAEIVGAVTTWQGEVAKKKGQVIRLVAPKPEPGKPVAPIMGHDSRLAQVFTNLIDNARSFTPEGGTITLTMEPEERNITVRVEDEGPGLRADVMERVFERFYTDRPEGEAFGNNSGLGLAISRQIVEAHRGTITAGNVEDADGTVCGARFIVTIPRGLPA